MIEVNVSEDGETISFGNRKIKKEIFGYSISDNRGSVNLTHAQAAEFIHFANHFSTTISGHEYEEPKEKYKGRG